MYITVSYAASNPADDAADPSILDIAVDHALEEAGFIKAWRPIPGDRTVLANMPKGQDEGMVADAQTKLRELPATFIVTRSDNGFAIGRSSDIPKAKTDETSDFRT